LAPRIPKTHENPKYDVTFVKALNGECERKTLPRVY